MQPYFIPYSGYFRLFAVTDIFVLYDCVQFSRSGWLHRNRLPNAGGDYHWLTLPLRKAPREVLIRELQFRGAAVEEMEAQFRRFPALGSSAARPLMERMRDFSGTPLDYIERLLRYVTEQLGLPWRVMRSSSLNVAPAIKGQDRILAIAGQLGAACYVNAPGGRALYDPARFNEAGILLRFLSLHEGSNASIAERLITDGPVAIAAEIAAGARLTP